MADPSQGEMTEKEQWARAHPDKMTREEYSDALRDAREELFSGKEPQSKPKAIILAGQPGSGKSLLAQKAQEELNAKGGGVVIDVDELREFHPRYTQLAKEDYETAATRVQPDASQLSKDLRAEATNGHYNLIIDGTLNNPAKAEKMARELKAAGYKVDIRAMAVPKAISEQGVAGRLENALADPNGRAIPRIVEPSVQKEAYEGLPSALEHIEKLGVADRVEVYERGSSSPIYDSSNTTSVGGDASKTLVAARERELTPEQKADLAKNWDRISQQAEARHAPSQTLNEYQAERANAHSQLRADPKAAAVYDATATPEQQANSQKLASEDKALPKSSASPLAPESTSPLPQTQQAPSQAAPTEAVGNKASLNIPPSTEAPAKVITSSNAFGAVDAHTGRAVGAAGIAVGVAETAIAIKQGDYVVAAQQGTMTAVGAAAQSESTLKMAGKFVAKAAPSIIRAGGEEVPLVGGVVAAGFAAWDIGSAAIGAIRGENSWTKVGTTAAANAAEIGGGLLGFGAGQAARQGVVEASKATLGTENAPTDAAVVSLGKEIYGAASSAIDQKSDQPMSGQTAAFPTNLSPNRGRGAGILRREQSAIASVDQPHDDAQKPAADPSLQNNAGSPPVRQPQRQTAMLSP